MEEEILDIPPEDLSRKECTIFSSDKKLKKEYENKWGTTGQCKS